VAKEAFKLNVSDLKIIKLTVGGLRKKASKIVMDTDEMGNPTPTDKNALLIMDEDENLAGVFRKDLFSGMINVMAGDRWCLSDKKFPRTLKNDDIFQIKRYIIDKYGLQYKQAAIDEAITSSAVKNNYDSLNDYLNGLKWDGVPRVDNWMVEACGVKDNEYHKWVGKLFLISAVKRAFNPGIKYDHVIVFAGAQGSLKSTMIEELAGEERYSCMKLDEKDKEIIQKMQGRWIIELGEGVPLRKKDSSVFTFHPMAN
jgi:putative DNA primase/helicase